MSERIDKAHAALTDAVHAYEKLDDVSSLERVYILLRIAEVQAQLAIAENQVSALELSQEIWTAARA